MDFHSLTRRELQSLCKLNKIPANITNVAMADSLQSLEIVEGIEEFLNVSQSETADLVESKEKVEISSTKVPQSRCRTSTRQKVKIIEAESLPPTASRTTRRGSKQLAGEVQESKNDMQTPDLSSTRRKALATSSCRNVNSQLNECEEEAKEEGMVDQKTECVPNSPAEALTNNRRKGATALTTLKKESTAQKTYSTRRSTRLTEKKSTEPRAKKENDKAVKINSFLDEVVDVPSKMVTCNLVDVPKNTVASVNPNAELEDICNAFEKDLNIEATHISQEDKVDSGELDNLKAESDETSNPCEKGDLEEKLNIEEKFHHEEKDSFEAENNEVRDLKPESDGISIPSEHEDLEEKLDLGEETLDAIEMSSEAISGDNLSAVDDHNLVMVPEEHSDSLLDNNAHFESVVAGADEIDAEENSSDTPEFCVVSEMNQVPESNGSSTDMILSNTENPSECSESDNENTKDVEEAFENMVDVDMVEHLTETNVDMKAEAPQNLNYADPADADSGLEEETHGFEGSSIRVDDVVVSTIEEKDQFSVFQNPSNCVMPVKKSLSKTPMSLKQMSIVSDDKENMDSGRKLQVVFVEDDGGKKKKKDENEKMRSLTELSIRQLRKQVKALTLKNINANEDAPTKEAMVTRPALQALCTNQLAVGETKK